MVISDQAEKENGEWSCSQWRAWFPAAWTSHWEGSHHQCQGSALHLLLHYTKGRLWPGQIGSSSRSSRLLCHLGAWLVLFHTYPVATVVRFILQRLRGLKAAQVRSRRRSWKMTCSLPWLLFPTEEQLQSQEYVEEAISIPWETPRLLGFKFWII